MFDRVMKSEMSNEIGFVIAGLQKGKIETPWTSRDPGQKAHSKLFAVVLRFGRAL
jgi:hypothetical protein